MPDGVELELVWGESDGGSSKLNVEQHEQTKARVVVSPSPHSSFVRTDYQSG